MMNAELVGSFDREDMSYDQALLETKKLIETGKERFVLSGDLELYCFNDRWSFRQKVRLKWKTQIRMWIKRFFYI